MHAGWESEAWRTLQLRMDGLAGEMTAQREELERRIAVLRRPPELAILGLEDASPYAAGCA